MLDNLKCKLGFHKPVQKHISIKHKYRTTNKDRSKKRYYTARKGTLYHHLLPAVRQDAQTEKETDLEMNHEFH